ncbi:MAG: hypothetical protein ABIV13_04120 [Fimbriimonadales bacterium]
MTKKFGIMFSALALIGGLVAGGCVVEDEVDGDPDTTIVNPPAPDAPDVTVTPPAGGSVEIDR